MCTSSVLCFVVCVQWQPIMIALPIHIGSGGARVVCRAVVDVIIIIFFVCCAMVPIVVLLNL